VAFSHALLPYQLPRVTRTRAERLFDQQLWLWNHDVRHASGNLLLAYGFTCDCGPVTGGTLSSSAYSLGMESGRMMRVCESGMFVSTAPSEPSGAGVYVRRLGFEPRRTEGVRVDPNSCVPLQANRERSPVSPGEWREACAALSEALFGVAAYEDWVLVHFGISYRRECLSSRGVGLCAWRSATPIQETAGAWRELADWYRAASGQGGAPSSFTTPAKNAAVRQ
jgi:hypothetical protein